MENNSAKQNKTKKISYGTIQKEIRARNFIVNTLLSWKLCIKTSHFNFWRTCPAFHNGKLCSVVCQQFVLIQFSISMSETEQYKTFYCLSQTSIPHYDRMDWKCISHNVFINFNMIELLTIIIMCDWLYERNKSIWNWLNSNKNRITIIAKW